MKQLSLAFFAIVLCSAFCKAQTVKTIPNGDFENWNSTSFNDLGAPWITTNAMDIPVTGFPTVTQVAGQSGSAVHIQTYVVNTDTLHSSAIMITPYTQMPTNITGYYKCNVVGKDTAWLILEFMNQFNIVGQAELPITGSQNTFKQFTLPISYTGTPDSMIIGIASSNLLNGVHITPGSWVEMDELKFTGSGITQQIPNGNFDSWSLHSIDILKGWHTPPLLFGPTGSTGVTRSTDHVMGNYSVELSSQQFQTGFQISTGIIDSFGNSTGGLPYSMANDTLTGYYKYTSSTADSGAMQVVCQNSGNVLLDTGIYFTASSSWKYFKIPIHLTSLPDTMRIDVASSFSFTGTGGCNLWLDKLQLKSQPLSGIPFTSKPYPGITAFPNPAQNQLNIRFSSNAPSEFSLKIYNIQGSLMIDKEFNSGSSTVSVPIDHLSPGLYFYEVAVNGNTTRNKFVKE